MFQDLFPCFSSLVCGKGMGQVKPRELLCLPQITDQGLNGVARKNPSLERSCMSCCRARCDISSVGWDGGALGRDSRTRPSLPLQLALFHVNLGEGGQAAGIWTLRVLFSQDQPFCTSVENCPPCQTCGVNRPCSPSARSIYFGRPFYWGDSKRPA